MFTAFWLRRLALPLLLLLGVTGWSGLWGYAQSRAQQEIDHHIAQLQARGGAFACEDRQWQGFPLRLELVCGRTRLDMPDGPVIETGTLEAASHLHNPRRIAARTDSIRVEGAPNWSLAGRNIDFAAGGNEPDRLSFTFSGEAMTFADGRMPALGLDTLQVEGSLDDLPRTRSSDLKALLREAARRGSRITIDRFDAQMDAIQVAASGTVELGPHGPTGSLSTTVSNYKDFLADLESRGVISKKAVRASNMVIGLLQGGRTGADGEVTVALRFHEGRVFWGPFAVAEIPPLQ